MSHTAVASVLAMEDATVGERLVALSLASFANREHRAWPGNRAAALRAQLSVSQFLTARASLERRGALLVESHGGGRGNTSVIRLRCAGVGPWVEGDINVDLLEAVLCRSRSRGATRLLLAVLAAFADGDGVVAGRGTEQLRQTAGLSDAGYRRARTKLMAGGEVELAEVGGGRGRPNRWQVLDPRAMHELPLVARASRPAPASARPLLAILTTGHAVDGRAGPTGGIERRGGLTAVSPAASGSRHTATRKGVVLNGDRAGKGPMLTRVLRAKRPDVAGVLPAEGVIHGGVSSRNSPVLTGVSRIPAQDRRVPGESPPETPSQTPPANARTGREPQNPLNTPPTPLTGGRSRSIQIQETVRTSSGRARRRTVDVELDDAEAELRALSARDLADWEAVRRDLADRLGPVAEAWLGHLSPAATSPAGELLLACADGTRSWISSRYAPAIANAGQSLGQAVRAMTAREQQLHDALAARGDRRPLTSIDRQEAV